MVILTHSFHGARNSWLQYSHLCNSNAAVEIVVEATASALPSRGHSFDLQRIICSTYRTYRQQTSVMLEETAPYEGTQWSVL
jgi:hypothetical protein